MKSSIIAALGVTVASSVSAIELVKRDNPAHIAVPFIKERNIRDYSHLETRDSGVQVDTDKHGKPYLYWANFTIGTPPVSLWAELDTGSADLLVLTNNIQTCANSPKDCAGGVADASKSSTWTWTKETVSGSFGSGEAWSGNYATDTLVIGGATLKDFQFAGVTEYQASGNGIFSIFGIGIFSLELDVAGGGSGYNNLVYALVDAGYINTAAYSMYLEDWDQGTFLFGAVDKSKYKEPLLTYPIIIDNNSKVRDRTTIVQTGFGHTRDGKSSTGSFTPRGVLLDSGTESSQFTAEMMEYIATELGAAWSEDLSQFVAPCDGGGNDNTIDFQFGELTINIPFINFLRPFPDGSHWGVDGQSYCLMAYTQGSDQIILGDDFLRSVYLVYDFNNYEISMANINTDGGDSEIYEIGNTVLGAA